MELTHLAGRWRPHLLSAVTEGPPCGLTLLLPGCAGILGASLAESLTNFKSRRKPSGGSRCTTEGTKLRRNNRGSSRFMGKKLKLFAGWNSEGKKHFSDYCMSSALSLAWIIDTIFRLQIRKLVFKKLK